MFSGFFKFLFKNDLSFVDYKSTICPVKKNKTKSISGENSDHRFPYLEITSVNIPEHFLPIFVCGGVILYLWVLCSIFDFVMSIFSCHLKSFYK